MDDPNAGPERAAENLISRPPLQADLRGQSALLRFAGRIITTANYEAVFRDVSAGGGQRVRLD